MQRYFDANGKYVDTPDGTLLLCKEGDAFGGQYWGVKGRHYLVDGASLKPLDGEEEVPNTRGHSRHRFVVVGYRSNISVEDAL